MFPLKLGWCGRAGDGARYVPHRDNSTVAEQASPSRNANNLRELTCILYMNPHDWHAQRDGGCLRLHLAAGPSGTKETGCAHDCTGVGCHRCALVAPVWSRAACGRCRSEGEKG
jgi:hypothetical protein